MKKQRKRTIAVFMLAAMCILTLQGLAFANNGAVEAASWQTEATMPRNRAYHGAFNYGDNIYLIGGEDIETNTVVTVVDIYNTKTKAWSTGATMPAAFNNISYEQVGNKVYVMGGYSATTVTGNMYIYNMETNEWSTGATMPKPVHIGCVTSNEDKIYYIGGNLANSNGNHSDFKGQSYIQIYDISKNLWTVEDFSIQIGYSECYSYQGKIFLIGGITQPDDAILTHDDVYIYDPTNKSLTKGESLPQKNAGMASSVYKDKVYLSGGYNQFPSVLLDVFQIYDLTNNIWEEGPKLLSKRAGAASAIVDSKLYLFGGDNALRKVEVFDLTSLEPEPTVTPTQEPTPEPTLSPTTEPTQEPIPEYQLSILLGEDEQQQLSISNKLDRNKTYIWTSSDENVATVDENGIATGVNDGTAEITVKSDDGTYKETILIKVIVDLKLAAHIKAGDTVRLYLIDDPIQATWSSSDTSIATVDGKGVVKGIRKGLVKINAELDGQVYELYIRVSD